MIKEGALENPRPPAIFGLHTAGSDVGQIEYHSGPAMASVGPIRNNYPRQNSHGAQPQDGIDAMVVAAEASPHCRLSAAGDSPARTAGYHYRHDQRRRPQQHHCG